MNKPNCTATTSEVKQGLGPCTPATVIGFLYNHVCDLDVEQLKFLSRCSETASFMAEQLGSTVSGIGCLVSWDDQPGQASAGNFREGRELSNLLFTIADHVRVISELAFIGSEASANLRHKETGHV
jgi:hypothetical protein